MGNSQLSAAGKLHNQLSEKLGRREGRQLRLGAEVGRRALKLASVYKLYPDFNKFNVLRRQPKNRNVGVRGKVSGDECIARLKACCDREANRKPERRKIGPRK